MIQELKNVVYPFLCEQLTERNKALIINSVEVILQKEIDTKDQFQIFFIGSSLEIELYLNLDL